jgi:hypothetical protein
VSDRRGGLIDLIALTIYQTNSGIVDGSPFEIAFSYIEFLGQNLGPVWYDDWSYPGLGSDGYLPIAYVHYLIAWVVKLNPH